jgi:hypothetical protein
MDSDTTSTSKNINEFEFESDFKEALSTFYNYKKEYDTKINKKIKEIHNNTELTKDDKKNKFLKMKKTCIICGQSGGSIFFQDKNKLVAKCGNIDSPCKFNITLQKSKYNNIINVIKEQTAIINNYKNGIINIKLDFLHGLKNEDDTIRDFEELKTKLINIVKVYQVNYKQFLNLYNIDNLSFISIENDKLTDTIIALKNLIDNYDKTKDTQSIVNALELYKEIKIINKKLLNLKYKINEFDNNNLIQQSYTNKDLQVLYNEENGENEENNQNKIIVFNINAR